MRIVFPHWAQHFQTACHEWLLAAFGPAIATDRVERNHRFIEEALELGQACGATREEALQLVDYVFDRPVGEKEQEVGGVMTTLMSLCNAHGIDAGAASRTELMRCWTKIDAIRVKQAAKPTFGPLPGPTEEKAA